MTDHLKRTFKQCKQEGRLIAERGITDAGRVALITFVTAGYPTLSDTVGILKAMQDGGADIIELGQHPVLRLIPTS